VVVLVLALVGCGDDDRAEPPTTTVVTPDDLDGQSFRSTDVTGHALVPGTTVSLTFAEHRMSAVSACNTQNADFDVVSGRLRITSALASTELRCERPLVAQDRWIADFLGRSPAVELHDGTLTLTNSDEAMDLEVKF
jgi:heat shock protein HslJ